MSRPSRRRLVAVAAWFVISATLTFSNLSTASGATTITVDTTADGADANVGDGVCATSAGTCSLRAAIETSNALAGIDTIVFAIPDGDPGYDAASTRFDIVPSSSLPTISDTVAIDGSTAVQFASVGRPVVRVTGAASGLTVSAVGSSITSLWIDGGAGVVVDVDAVTLTGNAVTNAGGDGIQIDGAAGIAIRNGWVGLTPGGSAAANAGSGVFVDKFSSNATVTGNVIANNGGAGVGFAVNADTGTSVVGNSIRSNGGLAIDLRNDGVTPNDTGDGDPGPNGLQNHPIVGAGYTSQTGTHASLSLDTAIGVYRIDLYSVGAPDPSGHGELDVHLGSAVVDLAVTPSPFDVSVSGVASGSVVATATVCLDPSCGALGSTSEVSAAALLPVDAAPIIDPATDPMSAPEAVVSLDLAATDPEGTNLTWDVTGLPAGLSHVDGRVSGTIDAAATGVVHSVEVRVTDEAGNETTMTFDWTVATSATTTTQPPTTTTTTAAPTTTTSIAPTSTTIAPTTAPPTTTAPTTTPTTVAPTTTIVVAPVTSAPATTSPATTAPSTTSTTSTTTTAAPTTTTSTTSPTTSTPAEQEPDEAAATGDSSGAGGLGGSDGLARTDAPPLRDTAIGLLTASATAAPTPVDDSAPGLLGTILALISLVQEAEVATWPLALSSATALAALLLLAWQWWTVRLYVLDVDDLLVRTPAGDTLRLWRSDAAMWGRRRPGGKVVDLDTAIGHAVAPLAALALVTDDGEHLLARDA